MPINASLSYVSRQYNWFSSIRLVHTTQHIDRSVYTNVAILISSHEDTYMQQSHTYTTTVRLCAVYWVSRTVKLQLTHSISLYRTICSFSVKTPRKNEHTQYVRLKWRFIHSTHNESWIVDEAKESEVYSEYIEFIKGEKICTTKRSEQKKY